MLRKGAIKMCFFRKYPLEGGRKEVGHRIPLPARPEPAKAPTAGARNGPRRKLGSLRGVGVLEYVRTGKKEGRKAREGGGSG